jgi:CheY-like chemotaxis protein
MTNAIKHTRQGVINVRLECSPHMNEFVLTVTDTGCGIPEAFLAECFKPFTKSDSFSVGTGLGLYNVRGMVHEIGGTIDLQSRVGTGTTLTVACPVMFLHVAQDRAKTCLPPLVRETIGTIVNGALVLDRTQPTARMGDVETITTPDLDGDDTAHKPSSKSVEQTQSIRILVAEDNEISRKILVKLIHKQMKPVKPLIETAMDGVQAVERFQQFAPQVVLTDVSMPLMNGVAAASEMRRVEREQGRVRSRIYAITGLGSSDIRLKQEAMLGDASFDGWFIKGQDNMSRMVEEILLAS